MLYRIMAYIMLSINMILYCTESNLYLGKLSKPISIVMISISVSMYMLYIIKLKNTKLLGTNILYSAVATYIYPPLLPNLIFLITEYLQAKNYSGRYTLLMVYVILAIKIELNFTNILLGIIACVFTYEIMKYEDRILKLEERNQISQKLHDKIGHTLAGSIIQLEALKIVINNDAEKGKEMLENIIDNLRSGMDDFSSYFLYIKSKF